MSRKSDYTGAYLQGLLKYFNNHRKHYKNGILSGKITEKTLGHLYDIRKMEAQTDTDKEIIEKFENYSHNKTLVQPFKVPVNFLNGKTRKINSKVYINLLSFLLDYPQRPFLKVQKKPVQLQSVYADPPQDPPLRFQIKRERKFFKLLWSIILLLTGILLMVSYQAKNSRTKIEINNKNINLKSYYYFYKDPNQLKILSNDSLQTYPMPFKVQQKNIVLNKKTVNSEAMLKTIIRNWLKNQTDCELINGQMQYYFTYAQNVKPVTCHINISASFSCGLSTQIINRNFEAKGNSPSDALQRALKKIDSLSKIDKNIYKSI